MSARYRIERDVFDRYYIAHPTDHGFAWSGSRWMPHSQGLGLVAQISNFETEAEAKSVADEQICDPLDACINGDNCWTHSTEDPGQ